MIAVVGYVVCGWLVAGAITIWYLFCRSRLKNEYLDRTNDVTDVFTQHGVNHRVAQYFMLAIFVACWPIALIAITLETIGRGRSDRGDY